MGTRRSATRVNVSESSRPKVTTKGDPTLGDGGASQCSRVASRITVTGATGLDGLQNDSSIGAPSYGYGLETGGLSTRHG